MLEGVRVGCDPSSGSLFEPREQNYIQLDEDATDKDRGDDPRDGHFPGRPIEQSKCTCREGARPGEFLGDHPPLDTPQSKAKEDDRSLQDVQDSKNDDEIFEDCAR